MNCMKKMYIFALIFSLFFYQKTVAQFVSGCEDLTLAPDNFWNGSDGSGSFTSGTVQYLNKYTAAYGSWSGFSYSNKTDKTTVGYANQYSAITGIGALNTKNYIVGYGTDTLLFSKPINMDGFYVTNSTYAYLDMLNGSLYSKKFVSNDWFKLTIKGFKTDKTKVNEVEMYLADFRFVDASKNFILNVWKWVDLSLFQDVSYITFQKSSSDVGNWGMNTPDYFCMDELKVKGFTSVEATNYSKFKIYSNSMLSKILISGDDEIEAVRVLDLSGRVVFQSKYNDKSLNISMPTGSKGIYVVKVNSKNYEEIRKVIL